jgi:hypothetical protein
MPPTDSTSGKFNIQIGTVSESQVTIGDYNTVTQRVGLSAEEAAQLRTVFTDFKATVAEQAAPERRDEAVAQADELERAIVAEEPDPGRVRKVLRWFREHAPQLAGTALSVVVNPLVGKLVEGAGQAIADHFRQVVDEQL